MLTPSVLLSIIHKRVFFERKLGSSVSSAAKPGHGSSTQRLCMRWAHLPLSKSYSKFLVPGQLVINHEAPWLATLPVTSSPVSTPYCQAPPQLPLQSANPIMPLPDRTPPATRQPTQKKWSLWVSWLHLGGRGSTSPPIPHLYHYHVLYTPAKPRPFP